jgi:hypothetical protein
MVCFWSQLLMYKRDSLIHNQNFGRQS